MYMPHTVLINCAFTILETFPFNIRSFFKMSYFLDQKANFKQFNLYAITGLAQI